MWPYQLLGKGTYNQTVHDGIQDGCTSKAKGCAHNTNKCLHLSSKAEHMMKEKRERDNADHNKKPKDEHFEEKRADRKLAPQNIY